MEEKSRSGDAVVGPSELGQRKHQGRKLRITILTLSLICIVGVGYRVGKDAGKRYAYWLRFSYEWQGAWFRVASIPDRIEAMLLHFGCLSPELQIVRLRSGVSMYLDPVDLVDRVLMAYGEWEPIEWRWVEESLKPGDVLIDVGAHHGAYTLRAARHVGNEGLVIAVEPNPTTAERLRKNIALNNFKNVRVFEVACGDTTGTLTLFAASRRNTGMTSLSPQTAALSGEGGADTRYKVSVKPLDEITADLGTMRIALIKVDTEGAETQVLRGSSRTIRTHSPLILVETIPSQLATMGSSLEELEMLLRSYGYARTKATPTNALWAHER